MRRDESSSSATNGTALSDRLDVMASDRSLTPETSAAHSIEFQAELEELRRFFASDEGMVLVRLEDRLRRRLGISPLGVGATLLIGLTAVGIRLAPALLATAVFGEWTEIPWGRWVVVLVFFGVVDAMTSLVNRPMDMPSSRWAGTFTEGWSALLPTLEQESALHDLATFTKDRFRTSLIALIGLAGSAAMLIASWLFAPDAMSELSAGTVVLLALLLYHFCEAVVPAQILQSAFVGRETRHEHRLFWASPVDTPQVEAALRMGVGFWFMNGVWISLYLVMTVTLVSWESPAVVPLAIGYFLIGYVLTIGATIYQRSCIQRIVETSRARSLGLLRRRIEAFGPPSAELDAEDTERLHRLIELHNLVRDAPTTPAPTRSIVRAVAGLILPTIMFLITVFGEVYAERVLDMFLP